MNPWLERVAVTGIRSVARLLRGSFTAGCVCRVRDPEGRLLLVKPRYRAAWGLPGGFLRRGEQPPDAIRRELHEEIGLDLDPGGSLDHFVQGRQRHMEFVFAVELDADAAARARRSSAELSQVAWYAPDALPSLQPEAVEALGRLARAEAVTPPALARS